MIRQRIVEPELLDELGTADPRAVRARRDLVRINTVMGHAIFWQRIARTEFSPGHSPRVIADLGTGDGTLILRIARKWAMRWPNVEVYLVDRRPVVSPRTLAQYASLGWSPKVIAADVIDWVPAMPSVGFTLCNLFLHHFSDSRLSDLLSGISGRTDLFVACEPRRSFLGLAGSHLLGLLGCGPITRYDAVVSVRAGFKGNELAALWPTGQGWRLREGRAGLFTHAFVARRQAAPIVTCRHDP